MAAFGDNSTENDQLEALPRGSPYVKQEVLKCWREVEVLAPKVLFANVGRGRMFCIADRPKMR